MTQNELNAMELKRVNFDEGISTEPAGEVEGIDVSFLINKQAWLDALSSAEDALVLVAWLEAKRGQ